MPFFDEIKDKLRSFCERFAWLRQPGMAEFVEYMGGGDSGA